jgi:hypothetical protein
LYIWRKIQSKDMQTQNVPDKHLHVHTLLAFSLALSNNMILSPPAGQHCAGILSAGQAAAL